jgi:diguanylate cyclase (GGDEF)-like protein
MPSLESWPWFAADFLALLLAGRVLGHLFVQRHDPGAPWLAGSAVAVSAWAVLDFVMILTGDPAEALLMARWIQVVQVLMALGWLVFALTYTGQRQHLRRWPAAALLTLGAATVLLALSGGVADWVIQGGGFRGTGGGFGFVPAFGPWRVVHLTWFWAALIAATGILALHVAQSPRHVARLVFVLGAPLVAAAAHAVSSALFQVPPWTNMEPLGAALAVAALGMGLLRKGDGEVAPVARNVVVEEMEDAVVVLDRGGRIVDVNRSARERLGLRLLGPVPMPLGKTWHEVREELGTPGMTVSKRVDLTMAGGDQASFEVGVTLLGPQGGQDRSVLVLRDVTRQVAMEQDLRSATKALQQLAHTDELTGLWNRRHLMDRLAEEVDRCRRYDRPLSLILLDLDHFKDVNDTYGHAVGDDVLRVTARAMEAVCRDPDVPGRMGGEEFAVLLPETDARGARVVADRLRLEIGLRDHRVEGREDFRVTASLGVATLEPGSARDAEDLMQAADDALYRAKELGRNRVTLSG